MIKVRIPGSPGESMWAEQVKPFFAKLQNSPFFVYGYAADDIVRFDAEHEVVRLHKASGNKNYRIALPGADDALLKRVNEIIRAWMGDGVPWGEGGFSILLAYTVRKDAKAMFDKLLEHLKEDGLIDEWEVSN
jgi:hypothetical protein